MKLSGACHCRAVTFTVQSSEPVPFNRCYCEVCRKTAGAGGFAVNLAAVFETLSVEGRENISTYHARIPDADTGQIEVSTSERCFCKICGSALWLWSPDWPELLHPHASVIDTPLPLPTQRWHMMLGSAASWTQPCVRGTDREFDAYPDTSLAEWHAQQFEN